MKNTSRPNPILHLPGAVVVVALLLLGLPHGAWAQSRMFSQMLDDASPLLRSGSQGYLGVNLADVDQEKAHELKLKEVRGAIITLIDHDAPAGHIGLHINDVVLKLNGQQIEGAEQLRRILREIPAGHKVVIEISRDGALMTLSTELADRHAMEQEIWNRLGNETADLPPMPAMGMMGGGGSGGGSMTGGFHMPSFHSSIKVGVVVEPLTSQMADYLGVPNGVMVKQVSRKSAAATAGLRPFDVILRVGSESINTLSDWDRALRANQDRSVQITILRDKKTQTLILPVESKHHG